MKALAGWKLWLLLAALGTALAAGLVVVGVGGRALLARARVVAPPGDWPLAAGNPSVAYAGQAGLPGCNMARGQAANCPMFAGSAAGGAPAFDGRDGGGVPPAAGRGFGCH